MLISLQIIFVNLELAQQVSDTLFDPKIAISTYPLGKGPNINIDQGHANFHTLDGRYSTFAKVLRADGYQVGAHKGKITKDGYESYRCTGNC